MTMTQKTNGMGAEESEIDRKELSDEVERIVRMLEETPDADRDEWLGRLRHARTELNELIDLFELVEERRSA